MLWEITPQCDKGCSYCGSKDILKKKPLCGKDLLNIAKQIGEYGVEEVTLTGGEPGVLAENNPKLFSEIISILESYEVKIKAVTYGKLIEVLVEVDVDKFDVFGVSINLPQDMSDAYLSYNNNITMITNFGKHNIWDFDKLAEHAEEFNCWQIQLTMGDELLGPDGIMHLRNKIKDCPINTIIMPADNLQVSHSCAAGINSCSITYDGDVVACLSERSYGGIKKTYGSLLDKNSSLGEIWENEFKDTRFSGCRKCCRDCIQYPPSTDLTSIMEDFVLPSNKDITLPPTSIQMYAVVNPRRSNDHWREPPRSSGPMIYGVWP